jgi:hypothetical protein
VTAKEKLREIFAAGLIVEGGIAFSSEKAAAAAKSTHGIRGCGAARGANTPIYSGDASIYVLRAGVALLRQRAPISCTCRHGITFQHSTRRPIPPRSTSTRRSTPSLESSWNWERSSR